MTDQATAPRVLEFMADLLVAAALRPAGFYVVRRVGLSRIHLQSHRYIPDKQERCGTGEQT
ncbi:hypothetical protein ACLBX9_27885 [Methylobacterium sp. A49B]